MRFLVDRCAGRRLAEWLSQQGHDVLEGRSLGPDPGDQALLEQAAADERIVVTIDTDFAKLVFLGGQAHRGLVRLPDVPARRRIELMDTLLTRHRKALENAAVITVRGDKIRISDTS